MNSLYRIAFRLLCLAGAPIGGIRPRRMYHWLARRGWHHPEFKWYHDRRGQKLLLSPHIHLDRCIIAFGEYDKELHLGLELCVKPGMTCFDIGANIGAVSLHMLKLVGRRGRVHAFEPVPPVFERLIGNFRGWDKDITGFLP